MSGVHKTTPGFGSSLKEVKDSACGYSQAKSASEKGAWGGISEETSCELQVPRGAFVFPEGVTQDVLIPPTQSCASLGKRTGD